MGLIDTINNKLFTRESVSSNVKSNKSNLHNRISLRATKETLSYDIGKQILLDTQVATGFDILKYLLSSKQWVLIANENDTIGVYDFINNMLFNMETEVNEIVKLLRLLLSWHLKPPL